MGNKVVTILGISFGLFIALFIMVQIVSSGRNALGEAYRFFLPMAFFLGLLAPRFSCFSLVICALYIDLGKKFLVVGEGLYFSDLFFILGIPPVMLLGACIAGALTTFLNWTNPRMKKQRESLTLACLLIVCTSIFVILRTGVNIETLKALANSSAYLGLIFLIPHLFSTKTDLLKFVRFIIIAAIPAGLYAVYHFSFGLNDFEIIYYASGFSVNASYIETGEGIFGPFSSQGALSATMCMASILCLAAFTLTREERRDFLPLWLSVILAILFFTVAILSLKRGPILVVPMALTLFLLLRNRIGFALFLSGGFFLIVILAIFGRDIAEQLPAWQTVVNNLAGVESETQKNLFRIRTLNVRLIEFSSLSDSSNWVPFGSLFGEFSSDFNYTLHAGVVSIVYKLGYVPLGLLTCIILPLVWKLHGEYLKLFKSGQNFAALCTCLGASLAVVPLLGFGSQTVFPVPFFIGVCLGIFWLFRYLVVSNQSEESPTEEVPVLSSPSQYAH